MKFILIAPLALVGLATATGQVTPPSASDESAVAPIYGIKIPEGYRDWKLISVAHEAGHLNDIRAILGNEPALQAAREGKPVFPDGSIVARIAWNYVSSPENNRAFGREQSFVAGSPPQWYLQIMVKDSVRYAATGGWGYAQFDKDGKPADEAKHGTCFACHVPAQDRDYVFTRYAP